MIPAVVNSLVVNGVELRVIPTSFEASVINPPRNIVKLPCGPVEIKWPGQEGRTLSINVGYSRLDEDDAEALLVLCTAQGSSGATVSFQRGGGGTTYVCKVLRLDLNESADGWSAQLSGTINWLPL